MEVEKCIMPPSPFYSNERKNGLHRHEIFYGRNRKLSIKYGLVVFLTPEMHNMSDKGVHFNKEFDNWLKQEGQRVAMECYNWSTEYFMQIFGRNYL